MKTTPEIRRLVQLALKEDIGKGDVTSRLCIPERTYCRGKMIVRENGVIAGLWLLPALFQKLDRRIKVKIFVKEGSRVWKGRLLSTFEGPARSILTGERTALNFVTHLSGIATLTRKYLKAVRPYGTEILATRKTTPGLRSLEKYAIRMGGGNVHRMGLYDEVLVKENHLAIRQATGNTRQETIKEWIEGIRRRTPKGMKIVVEAQNLMEARLLLDSPVDKILLDNLSQKALRKIVQFRNRKGRHPKLQASGGITFETIRSIARTGVEEVSVGRLTHSAPALNISVDIDRIR